MRLPGAVAVAQPHHQDPPVAVQVLFVEPVDRLDERPGARARADEPRPVGERELRAVRVQPRDDVHRPRVEQVRDALVLAVAGEEPVDEMERRRRAGHLERVDVRLDQERGLLERRAGLEVRDRAEPDVAPFEALSDRLERVEVGPLVGPPAKDLG
jgi:hypothetical protein